MAVVVIVDASRPGWMPDVASRYEPNHDKKPSRAHPHPIRPSSVACTEGIESILMAFCRYEGCSAAGSGDSLAAGRTSVSLPSVLVASLSTVRTVGVFLTTNQERGAPIVSRVSAGM